MRFSKGALKFVKRFYSFFLSFFLSFIKVLLFLDVMAAGSRTKIPKPIARAVVQGKF